MLPKVKLQAPAGVGGQIHTSATQSVYVVESDGTVIVEAADVPALHGAGYTTVPHGGNPDTETPVPITSDSLTSDTQGATALDPKMRELGAGQSTKVEQPKNSSDFGSATPPHGVDHDQPTNADQARHKEGEAALIEQTDKLSPTPALAPRPPVASPTPAPTPAAKPPSAATFTQPKPAG